MAQQYNSDMSGDYDGSDYAELSGYYKANPVPANSLLTFNIYPSDARYFDLNRKVNRKVPNVVPMSYNVLEGRGPYTQYASGREGFRNVSPQIMTAGSAVMNNKYYTAEKDDSELLFMSYNNPQ